MWCYYNGEAMSVSEAYFFETKEEAMRFVQMATKRNMEEYPDEPIFWSILDKEDGGILFEVNSTITAEEAYEEWFGEKF